ncbi:MAG: ABC transporter ATP-binding protein [Clostridiales bacterium]|nr:ABC transporter ATP-binding protein [Clostridiales bacterium]
MKNIIEIRDLRKSYGDVKAVDGISFDVKAGSLFAFLGLNGAGKSTTINIICSILKKDSGKIFVNGFDLDEKADEIKALIGVVFQNSALDNTLTVKENLTIRAGYYGLKGKAWQKRLNELVEILELEKILKRPLKNLSGGQKRRVDIARGLINYPKILILDEPTTGLDPQTRMKIWDLIDYLRKKRKMTVFLTTHYMEEANKADNVVMLDSGRIVANDTPHNLKSKYSSDYIKIYMERNLEFEDEFDGEFEYNNDYYLIKIKNSEEAKVILQQYDKYMKDFEVLKGDMDDVFLNITGKNFHSGENNEEK